MVNVQNVMMDGTSTQENVNYQLRAQAIQLTQLIPQTQLIQLIPQIQPIQLTQMYQLSHLQIPAAINLTLMVPAKNVHSDMSLKMENALL